MTYVCPQADSATTDELLASLLALAPGLYSFEELCASAEREFGAEASEILRQAVTSGYLCVVAPVCIDSDGEAYNDFLVAVQPDALVGEAARFSGGGRALDLTPLRGEPVPASR